MWVSRRRDCDTLKPPLLMKSFLLQKQPAIGTAYSQSACPEEEKSSQMDGFLEFVFPARAARRLAASVPSQVAEILEHALDK